MWGFLQISSMDVRSIVNKMHLKISKIKNYQFKPKPRLKEKTCEYCHHKDLCPKWDGGRYINGEVKDN